MISVEANPTRDIDNPFLSLEYEPALENLGGDYYDIVEAARFPQQILRFRNDELLPQMGLDPQAVSDRHFIEAFGKFAGRRSFLALRYHGYQFGDYNPYLGDGRGFLYGQIRATDGQLYDLGTKGSGTTPYSRGADGRLTLKGGVREVLAAEALHRLGVRTSRCLSLVETGEQLWRGDEPSPTRSSVMVRWSRSHIRFGTYERLHYLRRFDLIKKLLDAVIEWYYPHVKDTEDPYAAFYEELVRKTAELAAQWMAAGFCHAVLNTDNMSIVAESFDYGPYAFIPTYDLNYTAAYFDYFRRYAYGNQPGICRMNLGLLQEPLQLLIDRTDMEASLSRYDEYYWQQYRDLMLAKMGLVHRPASEANELLKLTLKTLEETQIGYHDFFIRVRSQFSPAWRDSETQILTDIEPFAAWEPWRLLYHRILQSLSNSELEEMGDRLAANNPKTVLLRPEIEAVWQAIDLDDDWEPFADLVRRIRAF